MPRLTTTELKDRRDRLFHLLDPCRLCPRLCGARRLHRETGFCKAGPVFRMASWASHRGEEPPISGTMGSGTIFGSHCTMACCYCQNFPFSQEGTGRETDATALAKVMKRLLRRGVHNLNWVTPTHFVPQLLEAYLLAGDEIRDLPIVYNTSGFERLEVLDLLDGVVDIYLPDLKYGSAEAAGRYSQCPGYVEHARQALVAMSAQVGHLSGDELHVARNGLLVRHLVLPRNIQESARSLTWLSRTLGDPPISLMSQYFPSYKAARIPELARPITHEEYSMIIDIVNRLGFSEVWAQDPSIRGEA